MYTYYNHCHRATAHLQLNILLLLLLLIKLTVAPFVGAGALLIRYADGYTK
jgi:hypothetical protein